MVSAAGAGAGLASSGELAGRVKSRGSGRGVPSAFIGEREPERRFLKRRFAPKRPFATGSGSSAAAGGESFLFLSSLPSERFSFAAEGEVLRLGHVGARKVSILTRALYCSCNVLLTFTC